MSRAVGTETLNQSNLSSSRKKVKRNEVYGIKATRNEEALRALPPIRLRINGVLCHLISDVRALCTSAGVARTVGGWPQLAYARPLVSRRHSNACPLVFLRLWGIVHMGVVGRLYTDFDIVVASAGS
jgi:hypothetical protein